MCAESSCNIGLVVEANVGQDRYVYVCELSVFLSYLPSVLNLYIASLLSLRGALINTFHS